MITLKLATYSKKEANKLAEMLSSLQKQLQPNCTTNPDCKTCEIRHLCMDINQATMYAEEYQAER